MSLAFFERPILNSPYAPPTRHHALGASGQPVEAPPVEGRRKSELISPLPLAKKQAKKSQQPDFFAEEDAERQAYTLTIINEIRSHVTAWRALPNPTDWGVTSVSQRLLTHWRSDHFGTVRPFFCQVEAVETAIWLSDGVLPDAARLDAVVEESDLDEVYDTERHLLYVACTRARDLLLVSAVQPGSEFLADLGQPNTR